MLTSKKYIFIFSFSSSPINRFFITSLCLFVTMIASCKTVAKTQLNHLNEVESGQLLVKADDGSYHQSLHINSDMTMKIHGMVATVTLQQTFKNDFKDWVEGIYVFPLPEDSAINAMKIRIGEREIIGEIKEKAKAKKIYEQAKAEGKKAGLVEQERPNLFTQSVANIAPGESVTVEIRYVQNARYDMGKFSIRFPMTLTPRYIPGLSIGSSEKEITYRNFQATGWALPTTQVPDAHRITPFMLPTEPDPDSHTISIDIELNAGLSVDHIDSKFHEISVQRYGDSHKIVFSKQREPMLRDFELEWTPTVGIEPEAAFVTEIKEGEPYAMLMMLPPDTATADMGEALPREFILVLDTSGSMGGTSIIQARESALLALRRLKPSDRFNVIEFNSNHRVLFTQSKPATANYVKQAELFVKGLQASGGTEMLSALREALGWKTPEGFLKQIVFVTDGAVGNEAELFSLIHKNLHDARLFTVGIGSAPNSYFMRQSAKFGRGTFTHIGSTHQVAERMSELFAKLENPVLSNLMIQWPDGVKVESFPQRVPDLYLGEPLIISAKLNLLPSEGEVSISGILNGQTYRRNIDLRSFVEQGEIMTEDVTYSTSISALWGRRKIADLLDDKVLGRDPDQVRQNVLTVALEHQLMSPYTSFVAVEQLISKPMDLALQTKAVPNRVPIGQGATALMYPQTATPAAWHFLLGFITLFFAIIIQCKWNCCVKA